MRPYYLAILIGIFTLNSAEAAIILNSPAVYTQDFNSLVSSEFSSSTPFGWNFLETGINANTTYSAGTGSSTTGNTYSFGTGTDSDRAFGGLRSGNLIPTIGASFTNEGATAIESLQINYVGEQWRLGTVNRVDQLDFQYSLNATTLNLGTWMDHHALDFTTPFITTVGSRDGNVAANRTLLSSSLNGLNLGVGETIWIRWTDLDAFDSDDGLAIDDFSLTASFAAVPEPSSIAFLLASGLGAACYKNRQRRCGQTT
jgi:hypothetical protein